MKQFLVLHHGFEPPTPEIMADWNKWFDSIAERQVDRGHLPSGREISSDGTRELPFGEDSITGYTIFEAEDFDAATKIAAACPFVASTILYEIRK